MGAYTLKGNTILCVLSESGGAIEVSVTAAEPVFPATDPPLASTLATTSGAIELLVNVQELRVLIAGFIAGELNIHRLVPQGIIL